jgi:hypothetical protein
MVLSLGGIRDRIKEVWGEQGIELLAAVVAGLGRRGPQAMLDKPLLLC